MTALTDGRTGGFVPYRNSKLTRLLQACSVSMPMSTHMSRMPSHLSIHTSVHMVKHVLTRSCEHVSMRMSVLMIV